jgi:hypothetical protein
LKKAAQKLLLLWAGGGETSTAQFNKSFFASFCSQKEAFFVRHGDIENASRLSAAG